MIRSFNALALLKGTTAAFALGSVIPTPELVAQTPTIASVSPAANSFIAATSSKINITFSTTMNLTTISASNIRIFGSQTGLLSTTGQFTGNPARIFTPAAAFNPGERIWVTVKDDAESAGGTALDDPLVFDFVVGAQRGSATFNTTNFGVGSRAMSPAIGDLNGDGLLDMLVANLNNIPYRIVLNNGDGTFSGVNFGGNFTNQVALGDLDGDGDLDAIGANADNSQCDIILNNGDATFTRQKLGLSRNHQGVALGDLDGDGDLDAIIGSTAGLFRWLNNGDGTFASTNLDGDAYAHRPEIGDLDGDGDLDVIVPSSRNPSDILINNGNGTFTSSTFGVDGSTALTLGDLDGDGDLDALIAKNDDEHILWTNNGDATFSTSQIDGNTYNTTDLSCGDLDGDGDLDIVAANSGVNPHEILLNNGDATFVASTTGGRNSTGVDLGDMDGDGDLDIVITNRGDGQPVDILYNRARAPQITELEPSVTSASLSAAAIGIRGIEFEDVTSVQLSQLNGAGVTIGSIELAYSTQSLTRVTAQVPARAFATTGLLTLSVFSESGSTSSQIKIKDLPTITAVDVTPQTDEDNSTTLSFQLTADGIAVADLIVIPPVADLATIATIAQQGATAATTNFLVTPVTNASGSVPLTFVVNDGDLSSSTTIVLTVNPINDPPTISTTTSSLSSDEDNSTQVVLQLSDIDTSFTNLLLSATSSNLSLLPQSGISFGATGANTTLFLDPVTNANGLAVITVTIDDGEFERTTQLNYTVNPVNDPPAISTTTPNISSAEDNSTAAVLQLSDIDTPFTNLLLSATSSNLALVTQSGISFGATGANTTLFLDPVTNANGSAVITVTIDDGEFERTTQLNYTVNPVNDPPALATTTPNISSDEDNSTQAVLQLSDVDTPFTNLLLSATSSNLSLVTQSGISFGATGANTTLFLDPVTNANGLAVITVTIDDGEFERTTQLNYTVNPVNDPPAIAVSNANVSSDEDNSTQAVLQLSDIDTPFTNLLLSATSSDLSLVTIGGISFGATSANTTLLLDPVTNANGNAVITVTIDDGEFERTTQLNYTVNPVNDPPALATTTPNISSDEDNSTQAVLQLSDIDTPFSNLLLSATSSNLALLPQSGIRFGATGANTSLFLAPVTNANGSVIITVTVDDGEFERSTQLNYTVNPVNDPPAIAVSNANVSSDEDNSTQAVLQLSDIDTPFTNLLLSATSSNLSLVPQSGISFGVTGANTTLFLDPAANATGSAIITVTIDDGEFERSTQINYTVNPVNDPPVLAASNASVSSAEDNSTQAVLQLSDVDTAFGNLVLSATSSNLSLLPQSGISFGATGANTTLFLDPVTNATGSAIITVTVDDGEFERSTQLNYTVIPVNDPPMIAIAAASLTSEENQVTTNLLLLSDVDTPFAQLQLSATSSNQSLFKDQNLLLDVTAATVELTLTPDCGVSGSAQIIVSVDDGEYIRSTEFNITVTPLTALRITGATCACPGEAQRYRALPETNLAQQVWTVIGGRIRSGQGSNEIEVLWESGVTNASISLSRTITAGCTSASVLAVEAKEIQALPDFVLLNNSTAQIDVLQNDLGDGLTILAAAGPTGSTVTVSGANLNFTPETGFTGIARLEYTIENSASCTSSGIVTVFVAPQQIIPLNTAYVERQKDRVGGVRGLRGVISVALSPDGKFVYAAGRSDHSIAIFERNQESGALEYKQRVRHNFNGVIGLKLVSDLAISHDGERLYAAGTGQDALIVFKRDLKSGELEFLQRKRRGTIDDGLKISGMKSPRSLALSADGKTVAVSGYSDNSIAIFRFDPVSGGVRFVESHKDGSGGVNGLKQAIDLAFSLDGRHLYVAGSGDDAIAVFEHSATDSKLTFAGFVRDGVGGIDGIDIITSLALSADGKQLYACSSGDDAVAVFNRNSSSGMLTFVEHLRHGTDVNDMRNPLNLTLSPDGSNVWVAGTGDDALLQFERAPGDGTLTFIGTMRDDDTGVDGLAGVRMVAIAPQSSHAYAAGFKDNAIAVLLLNRSPQAVSDLVNLTPSAAPLDIQVLNNDSDVEGHQLTVSSVVQPALGSVIINSGGTTVQYSTGATVDVDSFSYTIADGFGGSSTATVVVTPLNFKLGLTSQQQFENSAEFLLTPNPATDRVRIDFRLKQPADTRLRITDLLGNELMYYQLGARSAGIQTCELELRDASGFQLPSGRYFVELLLGEKTAFVNTLIIRR